MQPEATLSNIKQPEATLDLRLLIDKIKHDKGLDLSGYKESTIARRIERRMRFDGAGSLEEYIKMIDRDHHLYWRLISDFFIGVTDFFRDKEIYDVIHAEILPEIIERRLKDPIKIPIRIWSAGCSTGEETYSLAMIIREICERRSIKGLPAFVHGTDILEDKLEIAKRGAYSEEKVGKVEGQLRERYFTRDERRQTKGENQIRLSSIVPHLSYRVSNSIRYMTRFKILDLTHPKDYAGFDMIACRNVLIYFQRSLQEKVIRYFHKALRPDGILWLGKAESLPDETNPLFEPVYRNEKIFRKMQ